MIFYRVFISPSFVVSCADAPICTKKNKEARWSLLTALPALNRLGCSSLVGHQVGLRVRQRAVPEGELDQVQALPRVGVDGSERSPYAVARHIQPRPSGDAPDAFV